MKFAIMESVVTPGGHEIDYDRMLVEELTGLGHEVEFYVPEGHEFKWNYGVPVHYIAGAGVSYAGVRGLKKMWLSAKREFNRQRWYKSLYKYALEKRFDAIIFPSATYRYLRALGMSSLQKSPVPVLFIIHGLTPKEAVRLYENADKVKHLDQIRIGVQTFAEDSLKTTLNNVKFFSPPNYIPRDVKVEPLENIPEVLKLGFFGQYRKEKNLESFLDVYINCNFTRPVKLLVQGATQSAEDAQDFERIIRRYAQYADSIEFWHRPLIGTEWQAGIAQIDTLVMPYGNERYRYHTSAMLSTAIGFHKSVIIADNVNPEVLRKYDIGASFSGGDMVQFKDVLERFVNTFDEKYLVYSQELDKAYTDFAPRKLAQNIVNLAR